MYVVIVVRVWTGIGAVLRLELGLGKMVCTELCVSAVGQPTEAIGDLPVPRRLGFPLDFLDVLDCVEGEVQLHLSAQFR